MRKEKEGEAGADEETFSAGEKKRRKGKHSPILQTVVTHPPHPDDKRGERDPKRRSRRNEKDLPLSTLIKKKSGLN